MHNPSKNRHAQRALHRTSRKEVPMCPIVIKRAQPQLRRLAEDAALRSSLGAVGRSAYEKNHRRDVCQAALWDALDRL